MKLYEHEGKALLASAGVAVPTGALWSGSDAPPPFPAVAKAQLLDGGRGKRGGIRFVGSADELHAAVSALLSGSEHLPPAAAVLVEERVEIDRERYLAFSVDRRAATGVSLLAVRDGGVDVEEHARADAMREPLNPLAPRLPAFVARRVARTWQVPVSPTLIALLDALWSVFRQGDCILLEINPLAIDATGNFVAVDARVEVDDAARFRHPEWPSRDDGSSFEAACSAAGVVGTQLDGDIAILTSGAGLGLATLDLVTDAGATAACVVDLGGAVFRSDGVVSEVVRLVAQLKPRVMFINCLLQLASFDALAREIGNGLRAAGFQGPLVVRCARDHRAIATDVLDEFSPVVFDALDAACRAAASCRDEALVVSEGTR